MATSVLEFKKYERKESTELENLGTLAEVAGKGSKLAFIKGNLRNTKKRVAIVIENTDGESAVLACAESVSIVVRAALKTMSMKQVFGALVKMSVLRNEEGRMFISPEGGALEFFETEAVKKEVVEYEDLVVL